MQQCPRARACAKHHRLHASLKLQQDKASVIVAKPKCTVMYHADAKMHFEGFLRPIGLHTQGKTISLKPRSING